MRPTTVRRLAELAAVALLGAASAGAVALLPPRWASGASGTQVADGTFGQWRGSEAEVAGTWADDLRGQVEVWPLQPGAEYDRWEGDLDLAVGALGPGETWERAAAGAYDDRWRQSLRRVDELWERRRRGQLYLRFAHEMNGDWYAWSVGAGQQEAFRAGWRRFRALQRDLLPQAELVFSVNRESVGGGYDWRVLFPGRQHVDVMGVDYYNQGPHVDTEQEWADEVHRTDRWGGPRGLLAHQAFARRVGLPFAVPEWGNDGDQGEAPVFVERMRRFFARHAGDGPGQVRYEVYFNPTGAVGGRYALWPETRQPQTARAYRAAF